MEGPSALYPKKLDLTNCDKEPIHIIGHIQSHGVLLALDPNTHRVLYYSTNAANFFRTSEIENITLQSLFAEKVTKDIFQQLDQKNLLPIHCTIHNEDHIIISHFSGELYVLEIEPAGDLLDNLAYQQQLSETISALSALQNEIQLCDTIAGLIKKYFDYNRVMVYQFDANWNGKIVSERHEPELESWLGLHYPATDIPKQARKLFLTQGTRIVADVTASVTPIRSNEHMKDQPLDLSKSELRAVSPIHIEYLTNMDVGATLTAAIIYQNQLWGLIACHHYSPKFINYHQRQACKFITQVFSAQLGLQSANSLLQQTNASNQVRAKLIEQMSTDWNIHQGLSSGAHTILDLIDDATGAVICIQNEITTLGAVPEKETIIKIIDHIYAMSKEDLFVTQSLSAEIDLGQGIEKIVSGVLAVKTSLTKKELLLWFKPEILQTVSWGGNPNKPAQIGKDLKLSPRKSFEKWSEEQRGYSAPWKDYEIAAAKALKQHISEIIIERYDEMKALYDNLHNAYDELESFSYSVSHDLRAPLRGIDGFAQILKEDYFNSLDDFGKQAITTIISSTDKMNLLIDDILSFAGLGKKNPEYKEFSMEKLVEEVLAYNQVENVYPKATIVVNQIPKVYGDRQMIFQLMNNLIGNALKYTSKKENPKIEIGAKDGVYYVKDNGIGFNKKHEEKMFGVFNRLVTDEYTGSGIGLAIVKRVLDKHKGKIWTESELDKGATFYFTLEDKEKQTIK